MCAVFGTINKIMKRLRDLEISKKHAFIGITLIVLGIVVYGNHYLGKIKTPTPYYHFGESQVAPDQSSSVSMSDVAGHWVNDSDMVDITLDSSGSCTLSYGHNDPSRGSWRLNGSTVVIDPGDGGASLSFVYQSGKLIASNGHSLTPQ